MKGAANSSRPSAGSSTGWASRRLDWASRNPRQAARRRWMEENCDLCVTEPASGSLYGKRLMPRSAAKSHEAAEGQKRQRGRLGHTGAFEDQAGLGDRAGYGRNEFKAV